MSCPIFHWRKVDRRRLGVEDSRIGFSGTLSGSRNARVGRNGVQQKREERVNECDKVQAKNWPM